MLNRQQLENAAGVSYETRWGQLIADKPAFVKEMQSLQKDHDEKRRLNRWATTGNYDYMLMQLVWTDYHANGQKSTPPPPTPSTSPPHPEAEFWNRMRMPLNRRSAQPALTQTRPHEQVVQWTQGNRIIMRPTDREVTPGEPMSSVRIVR
jgi:hypothetical protein